MNGANGSDKRLEELIISLKESLERELQGVSTRLERIETRLDRIGGIVQSGVRFSARITEWSESVDKMLADRDRRMDEFDARLRKLEGDAA